VIPIKTGLGSDDLKPQIVDTFAQEVVEISSQDKEQRNHIGNEG